MRLEVLADNRGAVIYVLNKPEIYIGSTDTNDIVIPSTEISKKHLKLIITEDKKCFVVDQGSTNGTFLNDERLVPGRREEFKLFSSLRLGDKVLLTLLDKDKGELPELPLREQFAEEKKIQIADEDKTKVISLKALQKAKTEKVRKKRLKKLEKDLKKKKIKRQDKSTLNRAIFSALIVIGIGYGAMKSLDIYKKRKARTTIMAQLKETQIIVDDTLESIEDTVSELPTQILEVAEIARHSEDVNCSLPEESFFCKRMPRGSKRKNGALNINGQLVIYIEMKEWMSRAQTLTTQYTELNLKKNDVSEANRVVEKRVAMNDDDPAIEVTETGLTDEGATIEMIYRIAFLTFIKEHLSIPVPVEFLDYNLHFVFYSHVGSGMEIASVMAMKGKSLPKVNARYTEDFFRFRKYNPYKILRRLDRFVKVY